MCILKCSKVSMVFLTEVLVRLNNTLDRDDDFSVHSTLHNELERFTKGCVNLILGLKRGTGCPRHSQSRERTSQSLRKNSEQP